MPHMDQEAIFIEMAVLIKRKFPRVATNIVDNPSYHNLSQENLQIWMRLTLCVTFETKE
jgi:hypothetical protein